MRKMCIVFILYGSENSPSIKPFSEVRMSLQTSNSSDEKLQKILAEQGFEMTLEETQEFGAWLMDLIDIMTTSPQSMDEASVQILHENQHQPTEPSDD